MIKKSLKNLMMKKLNGRIVVLLVSISLINSCKSILQERLEGKWMINIVRYNSKNVYNKLGAETFSFNKDGTCRIYNFKNFYPQEEKWKINGDTLIISGNSIPFSGKFLFELVIADDENMILYLKSDSTEVKATKWINPLDKLLKH